MTSLWIVHRDEASRRALARLAGPADAILGSPGDASFEAAPAPEVVLLGLAGDLERELEFAHRLARRQPHIAWILVGEPSDLERARRLFDNLPASFLGYPPDPTTLRGALGAAARRPEQEPLPLSQRPARDALSERFARGFADLELPQLLRALDPRMGSVPVLLLGERGVGRATLARYLHHFGPNSSGALIELRCEPETHEEDLARALSAARHNPRSHRACTLWLAEPQRLPASLQRQVAGWVEFGPPEGTLTTDLVRWVGTAQEVGLERALRRSLGALTVHIPPLRERPTLLVNLANETVRAWCAARGLPPRRLGEHALAALEEYPWPGNLRELEAVIEQSLSATTTDPLGPEDLVLDGEPFAPLEDGVLESELPARSGSEPEPLPAVPATPASAAELALETLEAVEEPELPGPFEPGAEELLGELEPEPEALGPPEEERPAGSSPGELARLAAAVGEEVRGPLSALRSLLEQAQESQAESEVGAQLAALAGGGLARVENALRRLERLAQFGPPAPESVDVCGLLEEVLDKRRGRIHQRRLLVLEELDRGRPHAEADPEQLRFVFEALLDAAIELVPERGHVYLASRRNTAGLGGGPSVRVLLRFRGPQLEPMPALETLAPVAKALDISLAEIVVRSLGGTLTLDSSDHTETLVVLDLPS